jgi:type IV secretory pathway VirB10-like protein
MSETADQMAPDASPGTLSKKSGVRRVNNIPMYLLGTVLGLFLLVMAMVAADRAAKQSVPPKSGQGFAASSSMFAKEIAGEQTGGFVPPALVAPEIPTVAAADPVLIARPENPDAPPVPPSGGHLNPPADEEANRIRMAKRQMLEEAVKARTGVQMVTPRSTGSAPGAINGAPQTRDEMLARLAAIRQQIDTQRTEDPTAAYQSRLAQLHASGIGGAGVGDASAAPSLLQPPPLAGGGKNYAQFASGSDGDRWKLSSRPEAPRSPYELRAGFVVPATLISGINSDLPGQIVAQVSQSVYDTPTGKHLLIPQGSRLVGTYSSDVAYGQARVLIAWQRIVFPDGKAMDIGAMPGADSAGYAGFKDQANNHYFRLFASAFLMSGVTAGIALSQDNGNNRNGDQQRASDAMSEAMGQQLGQVTAQLIAKNLSIAPTLEIRPGYRFNVVVTKDMTFSKPYRSFDY